MTEKLVRENRFVKIKAKEMTKEEKEAFKDHPLVELEDKVGYVNMFKVKFDTYPQHPSEDFLGILNGYRMFKKEYKSLRNWLNQIKKNYCGFITEKKEVEVLKPLKVENSALQIAEIITESEYITTAICSKYPDCNKCRANGIKQKIKELITNAIVDPDPKKKKVTKIKLKTLEEWDLGEKIREQKLREKGLWKD
jgi:hypothetical protein